MSSLRSAFAVLPLAALLMLGASSPQSARAAAPISIIPVTGQLLVGGSPATGNYDLTFQLYSAATGGSAFGPLVTVTNVAVSDGVFYAEVDFGNLNYGNPLYVQTSYRLHPASGNPAYTALSPRHVVPTAIYAANANYATLSGNTFRLQGTAVSATAPTANQVLTYTGGQWAPAAPASGGGTYTAGNGLTLSGNKFSVAVPLSLTGSNSGPILSATNTGSGDYGFLGGTDPKYNAPAGVFGSDAGHGNGVLGISSGGTASGVSGVSDGGFGVLGVSTSNDGMQGQTSDSRHAGVSGVNNSSGDGVFGVSRSSGDYGFLGGTDPRNGAPAGVFGSDTSSAGAGGNAVEGVSANGTGGSFSGLYAGVVASDTNTDTSIGSGGVYGYSGIGEGVYGSSNSGTGVYGTSSSGLAGEFSGNVDVSGTLTAGTKDFKIDHPLDPSHKYLYHASVESDRMEDIYNGHVTLDTNGAALVQMPEWFQALNTDFEYTLTCIGGFAPVYIAQKVQNNRFGIAGGKPGMEVSWQVTGVRHDAFALAHPLQVEQDKPEKEQGLYQNPDAFGLSEEMGLGYAHRQGHQRPAQPTARP